jgi:hypothetical protein
MAASIHSPNKTSSNEAHVWWALVQHANNLQHKPDPAAIHAEGVLEAPKVLLCN